VRILCSRFLVVVAVGLLPICLGGLSGCGSKPADGEFAEEANISAEQKSEVKAQYQKRMLEKQSKSSKKGTTTRARRAN
jgi:hypothetical protein